MKNKLDLILSKIAYVNACLVNHFSLDLSKRLELIYNKVYLVQQSIVDNKSYINFNDIKEIEDMVELVKSKLDDRKVYLKGHKIACLLFEIYSLINIFISESILDDDIKQCLLFISSFIYYSGRLINKEILCFEYYI